MDIGDHGEDGDGGIGGGFGGDEVVKRPRTLPDDLPKSLDDRKNVSSHYTAETEMYDAWQGGQLPLPTRNFSRQSNTNYMNEKGSHNSSQPPS